MLNPANRIMNEDGLPPLDTSVIFNDGIESCKTADAAVLGNCNVLIALNDLKWERSRIICRQLNFVQIS